MASEQVFDTGDLRSASVDSKRAHEHKHKWALGEAWGPGRQEGAHARPIRGPGPLRQAQQFDRHCGTKTFDHAARMARKHNELNDYVSGDSSNDEDVEEASAAPEPDAEIAYSFDAARGPSQGSQILSLAMAQAVERFEDQATKKLVNEEYEVLDNGGDSFPVTPLKKGKRASATEEEDYEFV